MEQKTKNRIRAILVLFLFGLMMTASGLTLLLKNFSSDGLIGVLMATLGVLCLVLGIHLIRNKWW